MIYSATVWRSFLGSVSKYRSAMSNRSICKFEVRTKQRVAMSVDRFMTKPAEHDFE